MDIYKLELLASCNCYLTNLSKRGGGGRSGGSSKRQLKINEFMNGIYVTVSKGSINTLRTGDADLRFYITTVQNG